MNKETTALSGIAYLIGRINRDGLLQENYKSWFEETYQGYEVNETTLELLKEKLQGVSIKIFMATWCPDARREVPRFYKILDIISFNEQELGVVSLDRYKETPEKHEAGFSIRSVPTFIFYRNEQELGRIVERPSISLEEDMLKIIGGGVNGNG
ncbi:MAG: thioredoxin family protein [Chitinophagales bacterium]